MCSQFLAVWFLTSGILFSTYSPFWYYCHLLLVTLFVHNSPFWDLCTLASDLPHTAVAHTTKSYTWEGGSWEMGKGMGDP